MRPAADGGNGMEPKMERRTGTEMRETGERARRRPRFLALAAGMLAAAVVVYLILGQLPAADPTGLVTGFSTALSLLLLLVVVFALLFLAAYLNPRFGAFLADRGQYLVDVWRVPTRFLGFGGLFAEDVEEEKRLASERKRARHERRRYARTTRGKNVVAGEGTSQEGASREEASKGADGR